MPLNLVGNGTILGCPRFRKKARSEGRIVISSKTQGKNQISTMHDKVKGKFSTSLVDLEIQARLGQRLRVLYQDLVNEPIPEKFLELLSELEKCRR
jgi:hypothetical protein